MQITYLCAKHEDWIYSNPEQALHFMARDEMQGTLLLHCGQYTEAIPYIGCAFDIAVILLEVDGGENDALIHKVKSLAGLLEETYYHLNLPNYRNAILDRTHSVLQATESALLSAFLLKSVHQ
ncbi:hypothetical protein [uncultured Alteromonas sp.]|jgi:hypothetical protein|uniref:hypothetical protein n=1 Tax=uncultured Alteromonas sp. TaxID=179113 RepID=UPI0025911D8B|nr:hypothetical protein [uncultured Alteromonas sp.]